LTRYFFTETLEKLHCLAGAGTLSSLRIALLSFVATTAVATDARAALPPAFVDTPAVERNQLPALLTIPQNASIKKVFGQPISPSRSNVRLASDLPVAAPITYVKLGYSVLFKCFTADGLPIVEITYFPGVGSFLPKDNSFNNQRPDNSYNNFWPYGDGSAPQYNSNTNQWYQPSITELYRQYGPEDAQQTGRATSYSATNPLYGGGGFFNDLKWGKMTWTPRGVIEELRSQTSVHQIPDGYYGEVRQTNQMLWHLSDLVDKISTYYGNSPSGGNSLSGGQQPDPIGNIQMDQLWGSAALLQNAQTGQLSNGNVNSLIGGGPRQNYPAADRTADQLFDRQVSQVVTGYLRGEFLGTQPQGAQNNIGANKAFIQWAGLTAGITESFYDFYSVPATQYRGHLDLQPETFGDPGWYMSGYGAQLGNGLTSTVAQEQLRAQKIDQAAGFGVAPPPPGQARVVVRTAQSTQAAPQPRKSQGGNGDPAAVTTAPPILVKLFTTKPFLPVNGGKSKTDVGFDQDPAECVIDQSGKCTFTVAAVERRKYGLVGSQPIYNLSIRVEYTTSIIWSTQDPTPSADQFRRDMPSLPANAGVKAVSFEAADKRYAQTLVSTSTFDPSPDRWKRYLQPAAATPTKKDKGGGDPPAGQSNDCYTKLPAPDPYMPASGSALPEMTLRISEIRTRK
jgi:hypothetical protein